MNDQSLDDTQKTLCQDFVNSSEHRFRHPGSKNFLNVSKPSHVLHVSNMCKDVTVQQVQELIDEFQDLSEVKIVNHRTFSIETPDNGGVRTMMLVELQSTLEAVKVLCVLHN